jgi:hypothetical protein
VPGATVTITNVATSLAQNQTTSGEGTFRAVQLPPGDYTLTVNASGFGALTQTGYKVEVGSSLDANVTLQVNAVSEEVNVTAASVETTQSQSPVTINSTSIEELPINGRRFQDFATLTPKADIDPFRGQISLAGQRGINAQIQIDGADYTQPFFGGIRGGERSIKPLLFRNHPFASFRLSPPATMLNLVAQPAALLMSSANPAQMI